MLPSLLMAWGDMASGHSARAWRADWRTRVLVGGLVLLGIRTAAARAWRSRGRADTRLALERADLPEQGRHVDVVGEALDLPTLPPNGGGLHEWILLVPEGAGWFARVEPAILAKGVALSSARSKSECLHDSLFIIIRPHSAISCPDKKETILELDE